MSVVAVPVAPERTLEQRFDALAKAQAIRMARAYLKKDIKAGRKSASQILAAPPEYAENMRVIDLLVAIPKWGRYKAEKAMRWIEVAPCKTVAGITPRQRRELLRWLHGR